MAKTIYFELSESMVVEGKGRYFSTIGPNQGEEVTRYRGMMRASDRAWEENEAGQVRFVKHRFADIPLVQVDMKEFFWIKLKAKEV